jgi:hypothetical protein
MVGFNVVYPQTRKIVEFPKYLKKFYEKKKSKFSEEFYLIQNNDKI